MVNRTRNCEQCGIQFTRIQEGGVGRKIGRFCSQKCAKHSQYSRNREVELERMRNWRKNNPDKNRICQRNWYANNRERSSRTHKNWQLRKDHGITLAEYEAMCLALDNRCENCNKQFGKWKLRVDHDHKTGERRGLLCTNCNLLLGHAFDSPEILRKAALYLEKYATP